MFGTSGLAGAALALVPAVVALLVGVLDIGVHAVLGLVGALLDVAGWWLPGDGHGPPPYQAVPLAPLAIVGGSTLRAVGPLLMVLVAWRRPRRTRLAALGSAIIALAGVAGWPQALALAPGVLAGFWL